MKQNDFFEILPNYIKETKDLTIGSKNVLAALLFLNNNEYSKENGFFFRSNKDLVKDSQVSEPTLIKSLSQLEMMGFIQRKIGDRKSGASEYKLNGNFTQSLKVNFSNNFSNQERVKIQGFEQSLKKDFSNNTKKEDFSNQNHNKQRDLEENFSKDFSNNFSTDTDTEVDIDIINKLNNNIIILNNNIIILNNNLNKLINIIEEKENNNIFDSEVKLNKKQKRTDSILNKLENEKKIDDTKIKEIKEEVKTTYPTVVKVALANGYEIENKKELNQIEDMKNEETVEKKIIEHFNKENAAKHTPSEHYNIILPIEQKRIFNELMERFMNSNSLEEVEDKWRKFIKYLNSRTFMIYYIQQAQKAHQELLKKFQPTEEPILSPLSLPNDDGGIVAHPKGENPTDATKDPLEGILFDSSTLEDDVTPTAKSEICSLSPSNDEDGTITPIEEESPTDAKEMPLNQKIYNPLEVVEKIKAERMQSLKDLIDKAESVDDLRNAAKKVNSLRNSLSTNEMAELAEIMDLKVKFL